MRIIGVIDVLAGQTVAARAGDRANYQPIRSQLCDGSEPVVVARAMRDQCGIHEFYLADLDRLSQRTANHDAWHEVGRIAKRLWIDAGVTSREDLAFLAESVAETTPTATTIIVASESWTGGKPNAPETLAFSLDLKLGQVVSPLQRWSNADPLDIARELVDEGWSRFIVLDVAAVGGAQGCPTMELCEGLRRLSDSIEIVSGGGIRHDDDLQALEDAGCDAALVSTALHQRALAAHR